MDRGIGTKENIELPYILISRGPRNKHYLDEFENHSSDPEFTSIIRNNKEIRIKKVDDPDSDTVEVLCVNQGKKEKKKILTGDGLNVPVKILLLYRSLFLEEL